MSPETLVCRMHMVYAVGMNTDSNPHTGQTGMINSADFVVTALPEWDHSTCTQLCHEDEVVPATVSFSVFLGTVAIQDTLCAACASVALDVIA